MTISAIVRSRDEADRLRLTLASLARQTMPSEVIVVDDGSVDHTPAVLAEAATWLPLNVIRHSAPRGRSGASNAGARVATGDILLFLDGDTITAPEAVAGHVASHEAIPNGVGRGETFHLRCTRWFRDPETGTPRPGEEARVAGLPADERARMLVTREQIEKDFAMIDRRAAPGIYPGLGPRRLYELEMDALRRHPDCSVLWATACGSNLSVEADAFRRVGGFNEGLDIVEQRELALRLCDAGNRMVPVGGARTYHLTHRSGWRDPLHDASWEEIFYRAHPIPAVKLLAVFWGSLADRSPVPAEARIGSLLELEAAARGDRGIDYEAARRVMRAHPASSAAASVAAT